MAIREGRWDCQNCGKKAVRGRYKYCDGCGAPKPDNTKHYLLEDEPEVKDEKLLDKAGAGADWYCEHCDAANRGDANNCGGCGAPRGESGSAKVIDYKTGEVPKSGEDNKPPPPPPPAKKEQSFKDEKEGEKKKPSGKKSCLFGGCGCLGVIALIFIILALFARPVMLTVEGHHWERSIDVERYMTVRESGWQTPAGARNIRTEEKIHHHDSIKTGETQSTKTETYQEQIGTKRVVTGQRDMGNGFFEDIVEEQPVYETRTRTVTTTEPIYSQSPVYQQWYTYEVDKWNKVRTRNTSGSDVNPKWPDVKIGNKERKGPTTEKYTVKFSDDKGKTYEKSMNEQEWKSFKKGEKVKAKVNAFGSIVKFER